MRLFVIIPVFVLFLSNVPFIHEMPAEVKMGMTVEKTCMMKFGETTETSCIPGKGPLPSDKSREGCSNRCESTTTCICLFTFTAPVQEIKTFQVNSFNTVSRHTGFIQSKWKDPHIASPGQPPDHLQTFR